LGVKSASQPLGGALAKFWRRRKDSKTYNLPTLGGDKPVGQENEVLLFKFQIVGELRKQFRSPFETKQRQVRNHYKERCTWLLGSTALVLTFCCYY
jgi:hypothetical protein